MNLKFNSEDNFEDEDIKCITSLTKAQFPRLFEYCDPVQMYGNNRNVSKKDLITFLMKLRQGLSDIFIQQF